MAALPPVIVFAHGAGMPSSSPWMKAWAERLRACVPGARVHTFDYSYATRGGGPPKAETLAGEHADQVRAAAAGLPAGTPVILAGKSMGSRVGLHVQAEFGAELNVVAAVCFGYPLIGMNGAVRDAVLREVSVPVLFLQGSRDSMCPVDRLAGLVADIPMPTGTRIVTVDGGDHSLSVGKKALAAAGYDSQDALDEKLAGDVAAFIAGVCSGAGGSSGSSAAASKKAGAGRARTAAAGNGSSAKVATSARKSGKLAGKRATIVGLKRAKPAAAAAAATPAGSARRARVAVATGAVKPAGAQPRGAGKVTGGKRKRGADGGAATGDGSSSGGAEPSSTRGVAAGGAGGKAKAAAGTTGRRGSRAGAASGATSAAEGDSAAPRKRARLH